MALKAGSDLVFILDDSGSAPRTLSAYVVKVTMNLKGHGLVDVTTMGSTGKKWASDELEDPSFTVDFLYDDTANMVWDTLKSLRNHTAAATLEIGPYGTTNTYPKITGTVWLEELPLEVAVGDMIKLSGVPFKFENGVSITAYS